MKDTASKGLNGKDSDLSAIVYGVEAKMGQLGDALQKDKQGVIDYLNASRARKDRWETANYPYAKTGWDSGTSFHAPEFDKDILAFTLGPQETLYFRLGLDGHAEPGRVALDRAKELAKEINGADTWNDVAAAEMIKNIGPDYREGTASDIATFLRHGGFPTEAPAEGSAEFRIEVEALKGAWGACDSLNPVDARRVMTPVVTAAQVEWETEYAAQAAPRAEITTAEVAASAEAHKATDAMIEAIGQAWLAEQILLWQKYWAGQPKDSILRPSPAVFTQANVDLAAARKKAADQLTLAEKTVTAAKAASDKATTAQSAAWAIADAAKNPRGRGLLHAQQSAQVVKASYAAAQAATKTTQTAVNAAKATVADSKALYALSQTQAHAVNTEFRRAAALEAAAQAKSAATAAEAQAKEAAANATKAKAAQATAEAAEVTARKAAATAKEQRGVAEKERAKAAEGRANAASERQKAEDAEKRAQQERQRASDARDAAVGAGGTASAKMQSALAAEQRAYDARDKAAEAERKKNATASRAAALEAAAAAAEGTADAAETRTAATEARTAANEASTAATNARAAAGEASDAAVAARTAATVAEGASERANAAASHAWSAYEATHAAAQTAHAAAADAIGAAAAAAQNVKNAEAEAKKAAEAAVTARKEAAAAREEAAKTASWAAVTTGHAYAAAQAATAARDSAAEVTKPANEAISVGTPYKETDSAAAFAVLVGQSSKSMAEAQAAAAKAKADEAARTANEAKVLADKAAADSKVAAQAAAAAAADAAKATQSVAEARASATAAAKSADAAKAADANAQKYDAQAGTDAVYARGAANDAAADAAAANRDATEAERDASSARSAATSAENDATTARGAADKAEKNATVAETAAKNAEGAAKEANQSADRAEATERKEIEAERKAAMETGDTGIGNGSSLPGLSSDEEAILLAECGQSCVDEYREAKTAAAMSVVDWIKANGGEILLEVLGVNNVKRCFGQGDVESCLWTLVDAASLLAVVGKLPAVGKAIVRVSSGIVKFFEKAEWGKRTVTRLRALIERARKYPKPLCVASTALTPRSATARFASTTSASTRTADAPKMPCISAVTAGKNFKAHFISHRALLEKVLDKKYKKWKEDEGAEFLLDLMEMVRGKRFKFEGIGTLNKDADPALILRGEGLTLVLKENGEFWTLLESGTGMDLAIMMQP
ncbi:hypothetical protein [Streptomyces celluloflavus]|uniref:hypothetical protein n=1 Tax=Streptomyces celluloflavus TaxID=58344 RepID=UPI0036ABDE36